jgi:hypothetical protein
MPYQIKAKTIVESATIELDAAQIQELVDCAHYLKRLVENSRDETPQLAFELLPVMNLCNSLADLVAGATLAPAKKLTGGAAAKAMRQRAIAANPISGA